MIAAIVIEQQRDPIVARDVAAVLGEVGQQEQRARIMVAGERDERSVGLPVHACRQYAMALTTHQPAAANALVIAIVHAPPFLFAAEQPYLWDYIIAPVAYHCRAALGGQILGQHDRTCRR